MKLPALLKLALSWLTKLPLSTLTSLFASVATEAGKLTGDSVLTGKEKAEKVVAIILPLVPVGYSNIASAIIKLLIEVWYLTHKSK
jgi:phosphate/sulfate permease